MKFYITWVTKEEPVKELVEKIRKIFSDEKLELLIGYTKGTLPLRSTPSLIESADEADKLIFDFTFRNNLAKYLVDENAFLS